MNSAHISPPNVRVTDHHEKKVNEAYNRDKNSSPINSQTMFGCLKLDAFDGVGFSMDITDEQEVFNGLCSQEENFEVHWYKLFFDYGIMPFLTYDFSDFEFSPNRDLVVSREELEIISYLRVLIIVMTAKKNTYFHENVKLALSMSLGARFALFPNNNVVDKVFKWLGAEDYGKLVIAEYFRQCGKSETIAHWVASVLIFASEADLSEDLAVCFAQKVDQSKTLIQHVKFLCEVYQRKVHGDAWYEANKAKLSDNVSICQTFTTKKTISTVRAKAAANGARGTNAPIIVCDEYAFMPENMTRVLAGLQKKIRFFGIGVTTPNASDSASNWYSNQIKHIEEAGSLKSIQLRRRQLICSECKGNVDCVHMLHVYPPWESRLTLQCQVKNIIPDQRMSYLIENFNFMDGSSRGALVTSSEILKIKQLLTNNPLSTRGEVSDDYAFVLIALDPPINLDSPWALSAFYHDGEPGTNIYLLKLSQEASKDQSIAHVVERILELIIDIEGVFDDVPVYFVGEAQCATIQLREIQMQLSLSCKKLKYMVKQKFKKPLVDRFKDKIGVQSTRDLKSAYTNNFKTLLFDGRLKISRNLTGSKTSSQLNLLITQVKNIRKNDRGVWERIDKEVYDDAYDAFMIGLFWAEKFMQTVLFKR